VETILTLIGGISGALAVAFGAFGAHGLKSRLSPERLETFETAVRYHLVHSLAVLAAVFAAARWPASPLPIAAGWLFTAGILLFSGSLYALIASDKRWWGAVTPFGGVAFIAGWLCLALAAL
jgi:uncharacterized membrane protein YgdD (TMEM256/DUF423 family)